MAEQPDSSRRPIAVAIAALIASGAALHFIGPLEGDIPRTYVDAIGRLTSCRGHTGPELKLGQTFTPQQCNEQFDADLAKAGRGIAKCVTADVSPNEALAYLSMAYNAGTSAFCGSTLVRKLNVDDYLGACEEMRKWIYAGGRPILIERRTAERLMCEGRS